MKNYSLTWNSAVGLPCNFSKGALGSSELKKLHLSNFNFDWIKWKWNVHIFSKKYRPKIEKSVRTKCFFSILHMPMKYQHNLFVNKTFQKVQTVPLRLCFPNWGAVDPCGPRGPLPSAHHICCNSSFVFFYILLHLITFVLPF